MPFNLSGHPIAAAVLSILLYAPPGSAGGSACLRHVDPDPTRVEFVALTEALAVPTGLGFAKHETFMKTTLDGIRDAVEDHTGPGEVWRVSLDRIRPLSTMVSEATFSGDHGVRKLGLRTTFDASAGTILTLDVRSSHYPPDEESNAHLNPGLQDKLEARIKDLLSYLITQVPKPYRKAAKKEGRARIVRAGCSRNDSTVFVEAEFNILKRSVDGTYAPGTVAAGLTIRPDKHIKLKAASSPELGPFLHRPLKY